MSRDERWTELCSFELTRRIYIHEWPPPEPWDDPIRCKPLWERLLQNR